MRVLEVVLMTLGGVWQGIRQDFNLLELALLIAGAVAWKRGWRPAWANIPAFQRPWLAAFALVGAVIGLRLALLPVMPAPVPVVNDEFSHLLLADTLLHGRVANPTHPYWEFFESIHIIQQPSYVSNYFPGHAAVLAAGRWLFATPWGGVLLECAAFLLALFWMLRGWMPARWALFGLTLAVLRFGVASYWVNAFHGGFLAAVGGALVLGAYPRLVRRVRVTNAVILGTGLGLLMLTRPLEGAFFSLPVVAALAWNLRASAPSLVKVALAGGVVVIAVGATMAAYFERTTGSPLITPYQVSQKTYGWPMTLAFTTPPKIEHRHSELKDYYEFELSEHEAVSGPVNFLEYLSFRMQEWWRFFLGPVLSIPLLMLGRVWPRRRVLLLSAAGGITAVLLESVASPHYLAPATAALVAIVVECCRHLNARRIGIPRLLPVAMAAILVLRLGAQVAGLPYTQSLNYQSWCCEVEGNHNKARIVETLEKAPGEHLVFVRAKTDIYNLLQWIYNDADIDAARIVWARDLGPEKNAELERYFGSRSVWMVDPNVKPARLTLVQERGSLRSGR